MQRARCVERLPLDEILVCYHDDGDDCDCRKPQPGLLLEAADELRHRPRGELHGRRPLARHRGRPARPAAARSSSTTATTSASADRAATHACRSLPRPRDWILRSRQTARGDA